MRVSTRRSLRRPTIPHCSRARAALRDSRRKSVIERGALDEAETLLNEGLGPLPRQQLAALLAGAALRGSGPQSQSARRARVLAEDNPDDAAILNAYGYLLTDQFDRHEEARDYIERALALNPDSPAIIDSMGWVLYKLGDYGAACDYLERAYRLEQDPEIAAHLVDVRWATRRARQRARAAAPVTRSEAPTADTCKRSTSGSRHDMARGPWHCWPRPSCRACATLPVGSDGLGLEQRRAQLDSVGTWEMRGRLAVDTGERGFQGSFNWRQHDDALELAVRGPLGSGVLQVAGRPDALTVTARGETRTLDGSRGRALGAARLVAAGREPARLAARLSRSRLSRRHGARQPTARSRPRATALARLLSELSARADRGGRTTKCSCRAESISRTASSRSGSRSTTGNRRAQAARLEWSTTRPAQYRLGA